MTHVTCRLTAKNRDQLRNPTLGNQVWATFTFLALNGLHASRTSVNSDNIDSISLEKTCFIGLQSEQVYRTSDCRIETYAGRVGALLINCITVRKKAEQTDKQIYRHQTVALLFSLSTGQRKGNGVL